jgi:sulfur carrier protein
MTLKVNGEVITCNEGATLAQLITTLNLEGKVMAAAVNMNIVKQDQWPQHCLGENDTVELLDFVGGG